MFIIAKKFRKKAAIKRKKTMIKEASMVILACKNTEMNEDILFFHLRIFLLPIFNEIFGLE